MITEKEIIEILRDYISYMHKQYMKDGITYGVIKRGDFPEVTKAIIDKIKKKELIK